MVTNMPNPISTQPKTQNIPLLGYLPWLPPAVYAAYYPPSIFNNEDTLNGRAYKTLAHNLDQWAKRHATTPCVLLSSTGAGKSSSWTVMNLAYYLCQRNQKVLLMDMDFENPSVHHAFDIRLNGLNDGIHFSKCLGHAHEQLQSFEEHQVYWQGVCATLNTVNHIPSLSIFPNMPFSENAKEILWQTPLEPLFQVLKERFDWILLDSAPLLNNETAMRFTQYIDGIVLLKAQNTSRNDMKKLHDFVEKRELKLLGMIERLDFTRL